MKILKNIPVPTGNILIVEGELGKLECLSIGDYGKDVNIKADFLGLNREPKPVRHTNLLPLEEKWVITVSSQYTCRSNCKFCDVPKVKFYGPNINATYNDLINQVLTGLRLHPEVSRTDRLNIHFARLGCPSFNPAVLSATRWFKTNLDNPYKIHPVVSTMMPNKNPALKVFLEEWMSIKNELLSGEAGLQLSINSTDEVARRKMFSGNALTIAEIGEMVKDFVPVGRKITLNFALGGWDIDPEILIKYFDPQHFLCKLTPLHQTEAVDKRNMMPSGDYTTYTPYAETERKLKEAGYDVIVFVASKEEDESRITCGNAILANDIIY